MEKSLKTGFAQIFSCWPKNLSCPNFGEAAAPLAPPARTPMWLCIKKALVIRCGKWWAPLEEYNGTNYPNFCCWVWTGFFPNDVYFFVELIDFEWTMITY